MEMLTVKELAKRLKIGPHTIWKLRKKGLPFVRIGGSVRFDWAKVMGWIGNATPEMGQELAQDKGLEVVQDSAYGSPISTPDKGS